MYSFLFLEKYDLLLFVGKIIFMVCRECGPLATPMLEEKIIVLLPLVLYSVIN